VSTAADMPDRTPGLQPFGTLLLIHGAAVRRNRLKRGPLTTEGRQRLRKAALRIQPWRFATGPRTPEGKHRVALNGKRRQSVPWSVRALKAELSTVQAIRDFIRHKVEQAKPPVILLAHVGFHSQRGTSLGGGPKHAPGTSPHFFFLKPELSTSLTDTSR
jgi:hypothetical protein